MIFRLMWFANNLVGIGPRFHSLVSRKAVFEIATSRRDFRVALNCKLVVAFTACADLEMLGDFHQSISPIFRIKSRFILLMKLPFVSY
jgi:hypothetical protein